MKTKKRYFSTSVMIVAAISFLLSSCTSNDWPQFRGPDASMIVRSKNLPAEWNDSLNIRWTQSMEGESWSSPIITGDKVIYSSSVLIKKAPVKIQQETPPPSADDHTQPAPPQEDNSYKEAVYRWQLTCLDLKTGNELWKTVSFEGNPRTKKRDGNYYADETPVTDGKYVYVYYGMVGVYCYDLNGKLIWQKDLGAYPTQNGWGTGSSPVLYEGKLFVLVDNEENSFLVALDTATGDEIWRKNRDEKTTYSTPVFWKNTLRTEVVTLGKKVRSYDPENGELLWELQAGGEQVIPSPVFDKEHIYFGNAGGRKVKGNLFAIKAGAQGDVTPAEGTTSSDGVLWANPDAGTSNPSPVLYQGLIYLVANRGGEISCFDATSGDLVYKKKIEKVGACWATPWIYNDRLYFYDEKGVTHIIKTGREFEELGTNTLDDKFWATIAAANDAYIFKGVKNIYCLGK